MTDLELISLFDGIGGFPLAFSRAGIRTAATVEIDRAAAGVTAEHFPHAAHFDDVTKVTKDDFLALGVNPRRTVVSAGWPCPDLSLAGLRLGLGGARSGLIGPTLQLIGGLRPRWVVLENVPGLLSSVCPCPGGGACDAGACDAAHPVRGGSCGRARRRGRATGTGRCMALHGGGMGTVLWRLGQLGYGVAYRVLDAQHFGVPQRRRRVVIVGCLGDPGAASAEVLLEPAGRRGDPRAGAPTRAMAAGGPGGCPGGGRREVVATIGLSGIGGNGGADDNAAQAGHVIVTDGGHDVRRLTPLECERLQGYPDGWTAVSNGKTQADAPRYRQLGNSIAVPVFAWVANHLVEVDATLDD